MPIDKSQLHPMFEKSLRRSERLSDLATRKALDLPLDDDMQIITNNTRQGFGLIGTLLLSAAMLTGGAASGFALMSALSPNGDMNPQVSSSLPEAQEFKVTFWTDDGEHLEVSDDE